MARLLTRSFCGSLVFRSCSNFLHRHDTIGRSLLSQWPCKGRSAELDIFNYLKFQPITVTKLSEISSCNRSYSTSTACLKLENSKSVNLFGRNKPLSTQRRNIFKSTSDSPSLNDISDVAKFIKENASHIMVMVGAGISTPSGIPDFRSPGTGLYDNLQKYNLPYPEAVFDIHYFMMNHKPFCSLAQDLYPGVQYRPNAAHYFLQLLNLEGKLQKVYSQNIDGLERLAGIPNEKLMEAHGTFASASCTLCGTKHDAKKVKKALFTADGEGIIKCESGKCKGKVKPDIVFFGENLPHDFWNFQTEVFFTDMLLIIGTSLEVYPFASIADAVGHLTPRVLINRHVAGSFGNRPADCLLDGDLLENIWELTEALGWKDKLQKMIEEGESVNEE